MDNVIDRLVFWIKNFWRVRPHMCPFCPCMSLVIHYNGEHYDLEEFYELKKN